MPESVSTTDVERLFENATQRWLTRPQAAQYMGVSRETIRRLVNSGQLEVHRPTPRTARYDKLQIDAYMRSQADSATRVRRTRRA